LHVELEGFFEEIGRGDLLLFRAGRAGCVGRGTRLLFELNAFKCKQVFGSRDGVAEGTIGVVELRTGGKRGLLLGEWARGEAVGVQLARLCVEGFLERCGVDTKVAREAELDEVVVVAVVTHTCLGYRLNLFVRRTYAEVCDRAGNSGAGELDTGAVEGGFADVLWGT